MFSTFDLCLLLYVIRLAGWLKHCNLSLSLLVATNTFSGVLLGVSMLPEPIGSAHIVVVWLLQMNCT